MSLDDNLTTEESASQERSLTTKRFRNLTQVAMIMKRIFTTALSAIALASIASPSFAISNRFEQEFNDGLGHKLSGGAGVFTTYSSH